MPTKKPPVPDFRARGKGGLKHTDGSINDEFHRRLRTSRQRALFYNEMMENDPVIGVVFYIIDAMMRLMPWDVEPADESAEAMHEAEFLESCRHDMSHTWQDFVSEIMPFLGHGWSYFEVMWKYRRGPSDDPRQRSEHTDGRIGWRKFASRAQTSLDRWEIDDDGGIRGMWQQDPNGLDRFFIPIEKSVLFRTRTINNNPEGRSLFRNAVRSYYLSKRISDYEAVGIENDATGLPHMEVPPEMLGPTATPEEEAMVEDLYALLRNIRAGSQAAIVSPASEMNGERTGYKFDLVKSPGGKSYDTNKIIGRHDRDKAMVVAAQFLFLGRDSVGSFALSSDQTDMFAVALGAIANIIEETLNRYAVKPLYDFNGVPQERRARLKHGDFEGDSLERLSKSLVPLVQAALITPDAALEEYIRVVGRLPKPDMDEGAELFEDEADEVEGERDGALDGEVPTDGEEPAPPEE